MAYDGPAVVALVPETAARFVHDPSAGAAIAQRLTVVALPKEPPRVAVGGHSVAQQREELELLSALGSRLSAENPAPAPAPSAIAVAESREPTAESRPSDAAVTALTGWLLAQAGFTAGAAGGPKA
jgi:hypothetical protein